MSFLIIMLFGQVAANVHALAMAGAIYDFLLERLPSK